MNDTWLYDIDKEILRTLSSVVEPAAHNGLVPRSIRGGSTIDTTFQDSVKDISNKIFESLSYKNPIENHKNLQPPIITVYQDEKTHKTFKSVFCDLYKKKLLEEIDDHLINTSTIEIASTWGRLIFIPKDYKDIPKDILCNTLFFTGKKEIIIIIRDAKEIKKLITTDKIGGPDHFYVYLMLDELIKTDLSKDMLIWIYNIFDRGNIPISIFADENNIKKWLFPFAIEYPDLVKKILDNNNVENKGSLDSIFYFESGLDSKMRKWDFKEIYGKAVLNPRP